jgi:hypothetical protein
MKTLDVGTGIIGVICGVHRSVTVYRVISVLRSFLKSIGTR